MSATSNQSNQFVCIRRPESGLSAVFEEMYLNERLVDVTLSCSDGQLQAHKLVLAASSPYFSNLFNKLPNPFHYPVIIIKDMNFEDLKLIVDFIYKGQLTLSQEKLSSLTKSAENLQIHGLSTNSSIVDTKSNDNAIATGQKSSTNATNSGNSHKLKKGKKQSSTSQQQQHQQIMFSRTYQQQSRHHDGLNTHQAADKLLEQSMLTGESLDSGRHQFSYTTGDPTSTKNLTHQLHTPSQSTIHLGHHNHPHSNHHNNHHLTSADPPHNLANQFMGQVLSHSLAANQKSSMVQGTNQNNISGNISNDGSSSQARGRVHPCNICWKTFREKANLKRHLQVHSLDRIIYACPDCNKTFAWKDNYIRHTKTAHHMNNSRPQT